MVVLGRVEEIMEKERSGKREMELKVNVNCSNGEFLCNYL